MLSDIRSELVSDFGFSIATAEERAYVDKLVNDAAKELYNENELYLSEREQIFDVGSENQVIVMPSEVDKVLACRRYETRIRCGQEDMRPRYRSMGWSEPYLGYPYLKWRYKNRFPLKRQFTNTAPFTYTINEAVSGGFTLTITGKTNTAARITEVISFSGTDVTKTGTKAFVEYFDILKSRTISQDIVVTDADNNEMSVLPNNELRVTYPYYQILDRYESFSTDVTLVEVLYKLKFSKMIADTDSFLDDVYDKAIYWKAAAFYFAKKAGEDSLERAKAYGAKCVDALARINETYMRDSTGEIIYKPNTGSVIMNAVRNGTVLRITPYGR